jgi:hypothetical protein
MSTGNITRISDWQSAVHHLAEGLATAAQSLLT